MQDKRGALLSKPKRAGRRPAPKGFVVSEEQEQIALAQYLDLKFGDYKWFHVPNGGMRNMIVAKKLKAQGTKKGVPDNFIMVSPPSLPNSKGVVIELKRIKDGRTSPEQDKWLESLAVEGWLAFVCEGSGKAIDLVEKLYGK